MVSDGGSRGFLFVCFNTAVKYLAVAIIMLVVVAVVIMILWVNQETGFPIQTKLVEGINCFWKISYSRLGPMYHPERAFAYHESRYLGGLRRINLIPGGAMGVQLLLKLPNTCA